MRVTTMRLLLLAVVLVAAPGCGDTSSGDTDADTDADTDSDTDSDTDTDPGPELIIEQVSISGLTMGESALIAGPDGTSVLIDVAKLSHHGLKSVTSQNWVDWLFPADGANRNAAVGSNRGYSYSPASAVLDRLDPRVGQGYVWITHLGLLPASSNRRRVADGAVVVRATRATTAPSTSSSPSPTRARSSWKPIPARPEARPHRFPWG